MKFFSEVRSAENEYENGNWKKENEYDTKINILRKNILRKSKICRKFAGIGGRTKVRTEKVKKSEQKLTELIRYNYFFFII